MNTNGFGTVAYCEIGLSRSNVWRTIARAVLGRPRHHPVLADGFVELGEVLARPRRCRPARRAAAARRCSTIVAEPVVVVVDRRRLDHRLERVHLVVGEVLDEPEVEERDRAVAVEQVVARMRIAVERVEPVQAAEHEAEDGLAGEVALAAGPTSAAPPRRADDELGGQHPRRRQRWSTTAGTWMNGWPAVVRRRTRAGCAASSS